MSKLFVLLSAILLILFFFYRLTQIYPYVDLYFNKNSPPYEASYLYEVSCLHEAVLPDEASSPNEVSPLNKAPSLYEDSLLNEDSSFYSKKFFSISGSGLMKYIQWISTRRLAEFHFRHFRIFNVDSMLNIQLDPILTPRIHYPNIPLILVNVLDFNLDCIFSNRSLISFSNLKKFLHSHSNTVNAILYRRHSTLSTILYNYMDINYRRSKFSDSKNWNNFRYIYEHSPFSYLNSSLKLAFQKIAQLADDIQNLISFKKIVYDEEMSDYTQSSTGDKLRNFLSLLRVDISNHLTNAIINSDSYLFSKKYLWYDHSYTVQSVFDVKDNNDQVFSDVKLMKSYDKMVNSNNRLDSVDFVSVNRDCAARSIIMEETFSNTYEPLDSNTTQLWDRHFSNIATLKQRNENLDWPDSSNSIDYSQELDINYKAKPLKCGFLSQSTLDFERIKYSNFSLNPCNIAILTVITNCYDPLPIFDTGSIDLNKITVCAVAFLDHMTKKALIDQNLAASKHITWELIVLDPKPPFRIDAKVTEIIKTVGHRIFPMADLVIWIDGKATIPDLSIFLDHIHTPIAGIRHRDENRITRSEYPPNMVRVEGKFRKKESMFNKVIFESMRRGNITETNYLKFLLDVETKCFHMTKSEQENQYARYEKEGILDKLDKIVLFDIAILVNTPNVPCSQLYFCHWMNEVDYYQFRGQLSVFYPAAKDQLEHILSYAASVGDDFMSVTGDHRRIC